MSSAVKLREKQGWQALPGKESVTCCWDRAACQVGTMALCSQMAWERSNRRKPKGEQTESCRNSLG